MLRRKTTVVSITAIALLLGGGAGPAAAGGTSPTSSASAGPKGDGAQALCKRAVRIDKRIDKALTRLNGPASVRGSLARLQQRVDNAKAAGHDEVETYLDGRLTHRKSLVPTLQQRDKDLAKVSDWCKANTTTNGATR
ncbi:MULTISPECIES: hypothetical protein [Streptomyces]|uniref:hypothetical protein n=1 Tax=Streptomyces TaxID=1883 RepID=UPI000765E4BA|nr:MULTISPECIES: hypothetical protein [Streptomyces]MBP5911743.1 hypothetical protein [Streptomyces sp. LBUM 1486]MDX2540003.1 hypothetical protein [Streptomyces scabiei]MDX2802272.1 hypothetical protein [Streptomyces scabiei]MDX2860683.1 hypothetical protein [Streptomyces scabiei]MDX3030714.1 hypothetical protein [Streptomyces scabiei]